MRSIFLRQAYNFARQRKLFRVIYSRLPKSIKLTVQKTISRIIIQTKHEEVTFHASVDEIVANVGNLLSNLNVNELRSKIDFVENQVYRSCQAKYSIVQDIESILNYKTITVDFWDTLIGRFRPAESTKYSMCLYMILKENSIDTKKPLSVKVGDLYKRWNQIEGELDYKNGQASLQVIIRRILEEFNFTQISIEEMLNFDLQMESHYTYLINEIHGILKNVNFKVVSDFYRGAHDLGWLLTFHSNHSVEIYSSSDFGKTKRMEGKLFREVIDSNQDFHVESWAHVGDNLWSDFEMSHKQGAMPIHVLKQTNSAWNAHNINSVNLARDLKLNIGVGFGVTFMCQIATLGYSLATFAMEEAMARGKKTIVYVSREGEVLTQIHNLVRNHLAGFGIYLPKAVHLPCSRASVYMASYADNLELGLENISNQYPLMNAETFLRLFGCLDLSAFDSFLNSQGNNPSSPSLLFEKLEKYEKQIIKNHLAVQRNLLREYVEQCGISINESLICDIGWRGTIQDCLSAIFQQQIPGVYLGLRKPLYKTTVENFKKGFLFDETSAKEPCALFDFVGPLERAFTISDRSVIGYKELGGVILPLYELSREKITQWRKELMESQFSECAERVVKAWVSTGIFGQEMFDAAHETVEQWILSPSQLNSSSWFDEEHSEAFGAGGLLHYQKIHPSKIEVAQLTKEKIIQFVASSRWPAGYEKWIESFLQSEQS